MSNNNPHFLLRFQGKSWNLSCPSLFFNAEGANPAEVLDKATKVLKSNFKKWMTQNFPKSDECNEYLLLKYRSDQDRMGFINEAGQECLMSVINPEDTNLYYLGKFDAVYNGYQLAEDGKCITLGG